ncbi:MAG: S1-like domain-containing RNA-binding protein [Eubacteriales bacterium]|jgi:predicted RNA-binding protein (virulence factor B family)
MLELGKVQTLRILKILDFGAYLSDDPKAGKDQQVLLPAKEVPEEAEIGDKEEVFVYRDSQDRLVATTREPALTVGGAPALLTVKDINRVGIFLDWGLERDLLLPYHEQTYEPKAGEQVLVALYIDKSERLAATMKLYHHLATDSPYKAGDIVSGLVYETSRNFGTFVAVDDRYSALFPKNEGRQVYAPGVRAEFRVSRVLPDGKLELATKEKSYELIDSDAESVFSVIREEGGVLPFDDKAAPALIEEKFHLSKNAFKRAVGHLLKEGRIMKKDGRIYIR